MKRDIIAFIVSIVLLETVVATGAACTKQEAEYAKIGADLACFVANAELNDDAIKEVCKLTDAAVADLQPQAAKISMVVAAKQAKKGCKP